jgi:hypothetical protein
MNELPLVTDGVDGGQMKRAIPIPTLIPDIGSIRSLNEEVLCWKACFWDSH